MKPLAVPVLLSLATACTAEPPSDPASSASAPASSTQALSGVELCHALLLAPLDRKLGSCKAIDQGPELEAEKEAIAKTHAQCLEQIERPVGDGRLGLDDEKARACIAAIERAGNAWVGPHARVLDLEPFPDCRAMLSPKQAAGEVCTTALECPSALACSATEGAIGQCTTQGSPFCSPKTLSFGIARRSECAGATRCRTGPKREGLDGLGDLAPGEPNRPSIVRMGETSISGGLPVVMVQRPLRHYFGRFRRCYDEALRDDPTLVGEVRVSFTIAADGRVKNVSTKGSTFSDKRAIQCVAEHFEAMFLPAPGEQPRRVSQTIGFGSAESVNNPSLPPDHTQHAVEGEAWPSMSECENAPLGRRVCSVHIDCPVGEYCSTGPSPEEPNRCVARKAAGGACRQSSECKGRCANEICVTSCGSG